MKKCVATALYKDNQLYNLTVNYKGSITPLVCYSPNDQIKPYKYDSFTDMYTSILTVLRVNGYYCKSWLDFGALWFDIQFINIENPFIVNIYPYSYTKE